MSSFLEQIGYPSLKQGSSIPPRNTAIQEDSNSPEKSNKDGENHIWEKYRNPSWCKYLRKDDNKSRATCRRESSANTEGKSNKTDKWPSSEQLMEDYTPWVPQRRQRLNTVSGIQIVEEQKNENHWPRQRARTMSSIETFQGSKIFK